MIATAVEPRVSYVNLTLDTHAPKLTIVAPATIEPPDDWVVSITSDEIIGAADFTLIDPAEVEHSIGFVESDHEIELRIPSAGLGRGEAQLVGWVEDLVSNRTSVSRLVNVLRARAFDVALTISHAFDAWGSIDHAFEVNQTVASAFEVDVDVNHG